MSDLIEIYKDNINTIFFRVGKLLDNVNIQSTDKSENTINEADTSLKEADRIIKNMEIQLMTSNDSKNANNLKNFKNGLDQYKKKIKLAKENLNNTNNLDSMLISEKENQKEKLINNEEKAWNQYENLENAKRKTIEMESISIDVARELHGHTEKMKGTNLKLTDLNKEISSSNKLITGMFRRAYRNKIVLVLFSLTLICIFLMIVYLKLFGSNPTPQSSATATDIKTKLLN